MSFVTALVTSNRTITFEATGSVGIENVTYVQYVLSADSLSDHTAQVSANGTIDISFPDAGSGVHYRMFSFYQKHSGNKNLVFNSTSNGSIFDDGSYVVDHFDAKGAQTIIQFWEEHILVDGIREQLQDSGHYGKSFRSDSDDNSRVTLIAVLWARYLHQYSMGRQPGDLVPYLVVSIIAVEV